MAREVLNYDELIAGEVEIDVVPIAASQTIKRGDLLVCQVTETFSATTASPPVVTVVRTVADSFSKASAVADIKDIHVIAAEDIATGAGDTTKKIAVYTSGRFNVNKVRLGGGSTVADNAKVLRKEGILLVAAQPGIVSYLN